MYLGAPFSFALLQRFPLRRRHCAVVGLFTMIIGLVASSFATRVSHLILTQGVLYAIGGSMLCTPTIIFLDEWFIGRKGLAFGVMWAGTGNHPLIRIKLKTSSDYLRLQWGLHTLLDELGSQQVLFQYHATRMVHHPLSSRRPVRYTFRGDSSPFMLSYGSSDMFEEFSAPKTCLATQKSSERVMLTPKSSSLLYYVKPRLPVSPTSHSRRLHWGFLRASTFWILQTGNILESLGFFIPNIYLPTYARTLGLSSVSGTVTVSLFNTTSVFSQVIWGLLSDRLHITSMYSWHPYVLFWTKS